MKKILIATVASFGLFAAGATFASTHVAAQLAVNEGHEQSIPAQIAGASEREGNSGKFVESQHEEMIKQFAESQHEEMNKQFAESQHEEMNKQFAESQHEEMNKQFAESQHEEMIKQG